MNFIPYLMFKFLILNLLIKGFPLKPSMILLLLSLDLNSSSKKHRFTYFSAHLREDALASIENAIFARKYDKDSIFRPHCHWIIFPFQYFIQLLYYKNPLIRSLSIAGAIFLFLTKLHAENRHVDLLARIFIAPSFHSI